MIIFKLILLFSCVEKRSFQRYTHVEVLNQEKYACSVTLSNNLPIHRPLPSCNKIFVVNFNLGGN